MENDKNGLGSYTQPGKNNAALSRIKAVIPTVSSNALTTPAIVVTETVFESIRVSFGPGFEVLDVVTGFEGTCVAIGNLPSSCTKDDLRSIVGPHGSIKRICLDRDRNLSADALTITAQIYFATAEEATFAAKALHGTFEYFNELTAKVEKYEAAPGSGRFANGFVRIQIPAPGLIAYVGYETEDEARKIMRSFNGRRIGGNIVSVSIHHGLPRVAKFMLKFDGLPYANIKRFGKAQGAMFTQVRYNSLSQAINDIKEKLQKCGEVASFEFASQIPEDGRLHGVCQFFTADAAENAYKSLNSKSLACLGHGILVVKHILILTYTMERDIYLALQGEIENLTRFALSCHQAQILVHDQQNYMIVEMSVETSDDDSHRLRKVKKLFERIQAGEKLTERGVTTWHPYFSTPAGFNFLISLGKTHGIVIRVDKRHRFVSLFGPTQKRQEVCELILEKMDALRRGYTYSLLSSRSSTLQPVKGFQSLAKPSPFGKEDIEVDHDRSSTPVCSTKEVLEQSVSIVAQGCSEVNLPSDGVVSSNGDEECPICLTSSSSPRKERLHCGHSFCQECLVYYLKSAAQSSNFPLRCLGKEATCKFQIPMLMAKRLLYDYDYGKLMEAALRSFLYSRPKEFAYCPTPNCNQIYRLSRNTILQCPSCLVRICPSCNEEAHDGEECTGVEDEDEQLFQNWISKNGVKPCPHCKTYIEKMAGCNHMTCSQCQAHICWVCMGIFEKGNGIYSHMRIEHDGIGV